MTRSLEPTCQRTVTLRFKMIQWTEWRMTISKQGQTHTSKDRIIGGKKRIPVKIAKYPRNECKVCGKTFNGRSKWTLCKSCNDGTHKRCIRPGESLDNYKCQRCDPRRQEVPRARANEVNEESWSCDICEFVSLFKANLKTKTKGCC